MQHYSVSADHDLLASYAPIATAVDRSEDPSLTAFTRSARGFLDATAMPTHAYRITRGF